jgi:hypothetical protein
MVKVVFLNGYQGSLIRSSQFLSIFFANFPNGGGAA